MEENDPLGYILGREAVAVAREEGLEVITKTIPLDYNNEIATYLERLRGFEYNSSLTDVWVN